MKKSEKLERSNKELNEMSDEFMKTRLRLKQAESSLETTEGNYKQVLKKLSELVHFEVFHVNIGKG